MEFSPRQGRPRGQARGLRPRLTGRGDGPRAAFAAALFAFGCHGGPGRAPAEVAKGYARGLANQEPKSAYRELDPKVQTQLPEDEFASRLSRQGPAAKEYAARVEAALAQPQALEISAECGDGIRLTYEDGQWRLAPETLEVYSTASPEETLRTLVRAYRNGRRDVLGRLWAKSSEGLAHVDLAPAIDLIALALEDPETEVVGPRARLRYGADKSIELVLEGLAWKIEEFDR